MQIISHRGLWRELAEQNMPVAFTNSFALNIGTETDLRDFGNEIVISHDIPSYKFIKLTELFDIYQNFNSNLLLALNIKSDGLQLLLKNLLNQYKIENYFVFDMSIPDTISYLNWGINFFARQSEFELNPAFYEQCEGIWLDAFNSTWYNIEIIENHLRKGKKVAVVSADLHKRDVTQMWELLRKGNFQNREDVILCTDKVTEAISYFN